MASPDEGPHERRDLLLKLQEQAQRRWEDERVFEVDAPAESSGSSEEKYTANFPYPYMNGLLHVGHAFSLSKVEFATAFQRLCGKRVLFAQGFHCTGMPIKACADKLKWEIETYGNPPQFPPAVEEDASAAQGEGAKETAEKDPSKFVGKKSKAAAKKGAGSTQWDILKMSGIPESELPRFSDSMHWLEFFPGLAKQDISAMGCGVDWRRSFITTDVNPFYDAFIQWQFRHLKAQGKVVKDKRYAVYSPKDGQPCADHDRASGEGALPQEYTLVKMRALALPPTLAALEGPVYLLAATLRPETMYGQTNCWVLPEGEYGVYRGMGSDIYVMAPRAARNLSYQDRMPAWGAPELLMMVKGQDLIGTPLRAPRTSYEVIYVLPLLTISMNKGTAIVTSVPSDSPDDYAALTDLKKKEKLREKFGVRDEWVLPFEVIPIIHIPGLGDKAAEKVVQDLKIVSQNDTKKLAEAKDLVYLRGFDTGVMIVGPEGVKGSKVQAVKAKLKADLVRTGDGILYSEPAERVISRSGDECVVALTDQWYLDYGEPSWLALVRRCLDSMELYSLECRNQFDNVLGWLHQWACSRSFGLGSHVPWDPQFLIESLSDSTIYMAYYTLAHILQQGDIYGRTPGSIRAEDMTDEVWDYIFLKGPEPQGCGIDKEVLRSMRREFEFWYPFDLRTSGKDLIQNHLTFCLYNHTAIWADRPDLWPRSMRCNGHLLLNAEKMSKSTGNFKTLKQAVREYGADAMRMALADAGDLLDDANFEHSTANAAILRLTKELAWVQEEVLPAVEKGQLRTQATLFADRAFENDINIAVHATRQAYERMMYREALKCSWFDLTNARDTYRLAVGPEGLCEPIILRYIEVSTLLLTPICPHTCHHMWSDVLRKPGLVLTAGWPIAQAPDAGLRRAQQYLELLIPSIRRMKDKKEMPAKAKGGKLPPPVAKVVHIDIYVAERYGGWQEATLRALAEDYARNGGNFADHKSTVDGVLECVRAGGFAGDMNDNHLKQAAIPFAKLKIDEASTGGPQLLDTQLPFDEVALLRENTDYLMRTLNVESIQVHTASDMQAAKAANMKEAQPGKPVVVLQCR